MFPQTLSQSMTVKCPHLFIPMHPLVMQLCFFSFYLFSHLLIFISVVPSRGSHGNLLATPPPQGRPPPLPLRTHIHFTQSMHLSYLIKS